MRRVCFLMMMLALITVAGTAGIRPLAKDEKPHSFWRHNYVASWNDHTLDEYENGRINSDNSGNIQNEQMACINPTNPDNIVAVWRDFRLGYRRVGVGYTFDGGDTWTDALFPQWIYDWASDPILVVDDQGVFTAMMIHYQSDRLENGLFQISSYDGGVTWVDSLWAVLSTDGTSFEDKEMFAVDTSALSPYYGSFYCIWAHFFRNEEGQYDSTKIWITTKRPGGLYGTPVELSPQTSVQWPNVAIGINGEVYVSWVGWHFDGENYLPSLCFSRSFDGAATFEPYQVFRETGFINAYIIPDVLIFSYGALAVDHSDGPNRGRLYMLFTDGQEFDDSDVFISYSDDHGTNWSEPEIVHDDDTDYPVDQFHPWISVDEVGRVWVVFYDRRNDDDNLLMDTYFTVSEDGGETWRENERISDVSCNPGAGSLDAGLIGEYIGWCAQGGRAICVWTDTRLGNQDCFAAMIDSVFIDSSGAVNDERAALASSLRLSAYPNPTNSEASLYYSLPEATEVELHLYNTLGQTVRQVSFGFQASGDHRYQLDLSGLATGVYLAELGTLGQSAHTKLMLLR